MKEETWSGAEKKWARKIFGELLQKECDLIINVTRELTNKATSQNDLIEINRYLTKSLKEINRKYDYRYSQLITLFGETLAEGMISESDLKVFSTDKVEHIRSIANFIKSLDME
jgi:hypothetical protein